SLMRIAGKTSCAGSPTGFASNPHKGVPYEDCWQNQLGYRHHSASFSPALNIFMQVTIQPLTCSGAGQTALLQHGALHEGHKPAFLIDSGAGHHLLWVKVF